MEDIFFNGVRYSLPHKASCMAHYQLTLMWDLEDSRITLNRKKRKRYKKFWWSEQFDETGEKLSLSTEVRLAVSINIHVTEIITQQNIHKYTHSLLSFSLSPIRTHIIRQPVQFILSCLWYLFTLFQNWTYQGNCKFPFAAQKGSPRVWEKFMNKAT